MDPVERLASCPDGFGVVPPDEECDTRETLLHTTRGVGACIEAVVTAKAKVG